MKKYLIKREGFIACPRFGLQPLETEDTSCLLKQMSKQYTHFLRFQKSMEWGLDASVRHCLFRE